MAEKRISKKQEKLRKEAEGERTVIKGLGFCSNAADGNIAVVDVKDGKIIRIRPLHYDWRYKPEEFRPWKIEAHGKVFEPVMKTLIPPLSLGYKKRVYSPNRILYPLKRVDFDPKGDRNVESRGKSGYVRISWDEALEIIASEIRRIIDKYGPEAIFSQSDGHGETKVVHASHGCHKKLLMLLGGYTIQARNPDSWEGYFWGAKHVWGMNPVGMMHQSNIVPEIAEHTELLLFWSCDPETTSWAWGGQLTSQLCYWFTELGIKSIYICPDLNYGAAIHADKWIPILPNTDAALQLAIAYVWITEGIYDKEYVATHTVGFDKFEKYVLGEEDSIPKTPEWASPLCGVPEWIIKALAREWASKRTTIAHGQGGNYTRGPYSTEPARLEVILLGMQGLGKPGVQQAKIADWGFMGIPDELSLPRGIFQPNLRAAYTGASQGDIPKQCIAKNMLHDAILNPPISWYGGQLLSAPPEEQFKKFIYPMEGYSEIHMIWTDSPCWIVCWNDSNNFIKALRSPKIEFILAQHPWLEDDCLFADIVLPVNTKLEEEDIGADEMAGQYRTLEYEEKCIEPLGESKSDYEVVCMIAEKLGLLKEYTEGESIAERIKLGFDNSGAADYISYEEFMGKKYYVVPTDPEWKKYQPVLKAFHADPENNPLTTPTGKLEFYSQKLAEHFPDDEERPPHPKWIPYGESHQESMLCERAKKYPLLIMSNHPRWRVHAQHDDITWLREIPTCKVKGPDGYQYEPIWINPVDAAKRGIKDGDVVKVYNERGAILGGAYITERVMPGVLNQYHGARLDPIVSGELDRGGTNNTLSPHNITSKNATGMVTTGFLVEVERVNLDELMRQYPEAFKRPFHHSAGPSIRSFLYGGK